MSDFMNTVFGPLSGEYCLYFYYTSILSFFLFVAGLVVGLVNGLQKKKGIMFYVFLVGGLLTYLVSYFVNRLMFSVCTKSL
jgi:hypothetical protein